MIGQLYAFGCHQYFSGGLADARSWHSRSMRAFFQRPQSAIEFAVTKALRAGTFFVTTGEVLLHDVSVEQSESEGVVVAEVEWTFPLEFAEVVWGDGKRVYRKLSSATDQPPFGRQQFRIPFDRSQAKWVRFAVWDSAGNGAFSQPVHLEDK